jgi:hypothetical protein
VDALDVADHLHARERLLHLIVLHLLAGVLCLAAVLRLHPELSFKL